MYRFGDLINRATMRLAQQYGSGVQTYSEDILAEMMQHKFDMVFDQRWWEDYSYWITSALTADGVVETDLSASDGAAIKRYVDIKHIFFGNDPNPLPRVTQRTNVPAVFQEKHSRPYTHQPIGTAGKFFEVLPRGSTDNVHLYYRRKPDPFGPDDIVRMDDHLLILGTCYDYAEDDGANPGATAKFLNLYNQRYDQLIANLNEQEIPLGYGYASDTGPWGAGDHTTY